MILWVVTVVLDGQCDTVGGHCGQCGSVGGHCGTGWSV